MKKRWMQWMAVSLTAAMLCGGTVMALEEEPVKLKAFLMSEDEARVRVL